MVPGMPGGISLISEGVYFLSFPFENEEKQQKDK